jgi:hypothetical protein
MNYESSCSRSAFSVFPAAYELAVRCAACDEPLCPVCAVVAGETRECLCPERQES